MVFESARICFISLCSVIILPFFIYVPLGLGQK
jgi:hypothetical protein